MLTIALSVLQQCTSFEYPVGIFKHSCIGCFWLTCQEFVRWHIFNQWYVCLYDSNYKHSIDRLELQLAVLSHSPCHTRFVTLALSHSFCHTRLVTLVLSHSLCHTRLVTLTLSHSLCHTRLVTLALSHSPCHTRSVILALSHSPCHTRFIVRVMLFMKGYL